MAAVKGVNFTLVEAGTSNSLLDRGIFRGKIRVYQDSYEAAALGIGSTIQLGPNGLQPGIRIIGIAIYFDALGAATVDVGDADDADRYIDGADVSAVGKAESDRPDGANYEIVGQVAGTTDDIIVLTTIGAAITGTIKINIFASEE
jgi:hypothetical protein